MSESQNALPAFPAQIVQILSQPIDPAALSQAPRGLTSIKSIYITERLNQAFGLGGWYVHDEVIEVQRPQATIDRDGNERLQPPMVVVRAHMELRDYPWFRAVSYGGNNNADLGDAYKGAVSDAISKICAMYLGVAVPVYKGLSTEPKKQVQATNGHHADPIDEYFSSAPEDDLNQEPRKSAPKPQERKVERGPKDVTGKDAITEGKAKRFWAIAISKGKKDAVSEQLAAAGLSDIKFCPWKGETYNTLIAWAER